MICSICTTPVFKADKRANSVICSHCVNDMLRAYEEPAITRLIPKVGYPKGWRFMKEFVHADGTVYFRGVEQPELKGLYDVTPIEVRVKKTKAQKREEKETVLVEFNKLKSDLKKETRKTYKKKIEIKLKKLQKQL